MKQLLLLAFSLLSTISGISQGKLILKLNKKAGVYERPIRVAMTANMESKIYYTIDGSKPTRQSSLYREPLTLGETTIVRAIAYANNYVSEVVTNTFLIKEKTDFAIISMAVEPSVLFDETNGWFEMGPNADTIYPFTGANFWKRNEVKGHLELFETNNKLVFSDNIGVKLFGGLSRPFPQKSFSVVARTTYGNRRIHYQIFPNKKHKKYKHLVFRNSGSDFPKSHFRDAFMTSLMEGIDIEKQEHRPALLFLNGKYWGIYFIREKINRYFVEYNCGVDKDSIDLIERNDDVKVGDLKHYRAMIRFMEKNDLSQTANYNYIKTQMDVDNFMIHRIAQIYFENKDAGGNVKFWRPRTAGGKWRWILYDTDFGFGLHGPDAYKFNSIKFFTEPNGPSWPNPPWSTFILRKLLENEEFEQAFVQRFNDYLNSIFEPEHVVNRIDSFERMLRPEMSRHFKRWTLESPTWETHLKRMKYFARQRPAYIRKFLQQQFDVGKLVTVNIECTEGGYIVLNDNVYIEGNSFEGKYFQQFPITLKARPRFGYQFSHWEGVNAVEGLSEVEVRLDKINKIKAVYKKSKDKLGGRLIVTEISPKGKKSGDWIEIYNSSGEIVNLQDWKVTDAAHEFKLPTVFLKPLQYVTICQDTAKFKTVFPEVLNIVGNLPFGLSKRRETIQLLTNRNAVIDSVSYHIEERDSAFTLNLKHYSLPNETNTNWLPITGKGTPNYPNPTFQKFEQKNGKKKGSGGYMWLLLFLLLIGGGIFWWQRTRIT